MTLNDWLASAKLTTYPLRTGRKLESRQPLPRVVCADGTTLSVQAGAYSYCTPRSNQGPWSHVEVGYPSVAPGELWKEYCESPERPTDTIYAYVPIELVIFYIAAHGGMVDSQ